MTIARSHALLSNPKNALALLSRASEKSIAADTHLSSAMDTSDTAKISPPNISISPDQTSSLKSLLEGEVQRYRALVELSSLDDRSPRTQIANREPLVERLDQYPANGVVDLQNLVSLPPKLEPVPVKPLFFDAAWNYIEYPGREPEKAANGIKDAENAGTKEQTTQQKKGWFGFGR